MTCQLPPSSCSGPNSRNTLSILGLVQAVVPHASIKAVYVGMNAQSIMTKRGYMRGVFGNGIFAYGASHGEHTIVIQTTEPMSMIDHMRTIYLCPGSGCDFPKCVLHPMG